MNKKIYILDDSENWQKKNEEILKNDYEVVGISGNGKTAVDFILNNDIDLVLMDIVLQEYDGYEVLEKIQMSEKANKPKFLILSSIKGDEFAQKAIELGASYFMSKPIDKEIIVKRINTILNNFQEEEKKIIFKTSKNRLLDEKISNVFITVGIPAHIKGYQFLREAIKMAIEEPDIINSITKVLYPSIADRFSTSASKVERAIRHAIEVAWNRGKIENINALFGIKVYNSNEKPTNGEFIALVADKMLIEGA